MFEIETNGLEGLIAAIKNAGDIPNDVLKDMIDAQSKVVEEALIYNAGTMLQGPFYQGGVARSVTRRKPRMSRSGISVNIIFKGNQHGNRLGEIAFINEYGKKKQPARAFIKRTQAQAKDPAADAALKVLDEHLKNNNL